MQATVKYSNSFYLVAVTGQLPQFNIPCLPNFARQEYDPYWPFLPGKPRPEYFPIQWNPNEPTYPEDDPRWRPCQEIPSNFLHPHPSLSSGIGTYFCFGETKTGANS